MSSKRWIANVDGSSTKPAIYHCISRVVDRQFVFGDEEGRLFVWELELAQLRALRANNRWDELWQRRAA